MQEGATPAAASGEVVVVAVGSPLSAAAAGMEAEAMTRAVDVDMSHTRSSPVRLPVARYRPARGVVDLDQDLSLESHPRLFNSPLAREAPPSCPPQLGIG